MSMGEMLGWMQEFFVQLELWETLKTALSVVVMLAMASAVISFARGR